MPAIQPVSPEQATGQTAQLFSAIKQKLGVVPNVFQTLGHSPATLKGFLDFTSALEQGELTPALREQIALACAGANACDYCASAHTALGKAAGVAEDELARNLGGMASDPATDAALRFVRKVVEQRARLEPAELERLTAEGFSHGAIIEILGHVAANLFTNYFNHIAGTAIDFPAVDASVAQAA